MDETMWIEKERIREKGEELHNNTKKLLQRAYHIEAPLLQKGDSL